MVRRCHCGRGQLRHAQNGSPRGYALPFYGLAYSVAALNEGVCKLWPGCPEPTLSRLGMQVMKKNFTLDISRARHYLDYDPKVSLWTALDEVLRLVEGPGHSLKSCTPNPVPG